MKGPKLHRRIFRVLCEDCPYDDCSQKKGDENAMTILRNVFEIPKQSSLFWMQYRENFQWQWHVQVCHYRCYDVLRSKKLNIATEWGKGKLYEGKCITLSNRIKQIQSYKSLGRFRGRIFNVLQKRRFILIFLSSFSKVPLSENKHSDSEWETYLADWRQLQSR